MLARLSRCQLGFPETHRKANISCYVRAVRNTHTHTHKHTHVYIFCSCKCITNKRINPLTPSDLKRRRAVNPLKIKILSKNMREKPTNKPIIHSVY
jgi:hypothetical protein